MRKTDANLNAPASCRLTISCRGVNHGTFLHIAHKEVRDEKVSRPTSVDLPLTNPLQGLITNKSIHAGIRAPVSRPKDDIRNDRRCGFSTITARHLDKVGVSGVIQEIRDRVADSRVYISVDIDVLDPAYAPGTCHLPLITPCAAKPLV